MLAPLIALALLPACEPTGDVPRLLAEVSSPSRSHSILTVCDQRRGRRVLVRRAALARGTLISAASSGGRLVAWTEVRVRDGVTTTVVRVAKLSGKRMRVIRKLRVLRRSGMGFADAGVAITSRGELAWTLRDVLVSRWRLKLQRARGRPVRTPARGMGAPGIAFEDDRTLRWRGSGYEYLDLRPPRIVDGCPDRGDFEVDYHDDRVQVSSAEYGEGEGFVQRVCVRGSRRDHVIDQDELDFLDSHPSIVGRRGRWLVQTHVSGGRYEACAHASLRTIDIATGHRRRDGTLEVCDDQWPPPFPQRIEDVQVTLDGVPTWTDAQGRRWTVLEDGTIGRA